MPNDVILYLLAEIIRRYGPKAADGGWSSYPGYNVLMAFHYRVKQLDIPITSVYGKESPDLWDVYNVASKYDME